MFFVKLASYIIFRTKYVFSDLREAIGDLGRYFPDLREAVEDLGLHISELRGRVRGFGRHLPKLRGRIMAASFDGFW